MRSIRNLKPVKEESDRTSRTVLDLNRSLKKTPGVGLALSRKRRGPATQRPGEPAIGVDNRCLSAEDPRHVEISKFNDIRAAEIDEVSTEDRVFWLIAPELLSNAKMFS